MAFWLADDILNDRICTDRAAGIPFPCSQNQRQLFFICSASVMLLMRISDRNLRPLNFFNNSR